MESFTPISGFVGGLLIGVAVALMLLLNGRVAGISGIAGGLLALKLRDTPCGAQRSSPGSSSAPSPTSGWRKEVSP